MKKTTGIKLLVTVFLILFLIVGFGKIVVGQPPALPEDSTGTTTTEGGDQPPALPGDSTGTTTTGDGDQPPVLPPDFTLTVTGTTSSSVSLSWTRYGSGQFAVSYRVYMLYQGLATWQKVADTTRTSYIVANLQPRAYEFKVEARLGTGLLGTSNTVTATLFEELPQPVIELISAQSLYFGDEITFVGSLTPDTGKAYSYIWSSDLDGQLSTQKIFSTKELSLGKHIISLAIVDDSGRASSPAESSVTVRMRVIGNPVQVIPRFSTLGSAVMAYNVTPGYPNIYCKVTYGDTDVPCNQLLTGAPEESCLRGKISSPVLEFVLSEAKTHRFLIAQTPASAIPVSPAVGVGNLSLQIISPSSAGDPADFGIFEENDFLPSGLKLEVRSSVNIAKEYVGNIPTKGVLYSLYKAENCELIESIPLTEMDYFGVQRNYFIAFLNPDDCEIGETCNYVGEVIAVNGQEKGGVLFKFAYERPEEEEILPPEEEGNVSANPSSISFGNVEKGSPQTKIVKIENPTSSSVAGVSAVSTATELTATLSSATIQANSSATLTISLDVPAGAAEGSYSKSVIVVAGGKIITIPVTYEVAVPDTGSGVGNLLVSPDKWDIGKIYKGDTKKQKFAAGVTGDSAGVKVSIEIGADDAGIFAADRKEINLGAGETVFELTLTAAKETGTRTTNLDFEFTQGGQTIGIVTVPATYEIAENVQEMLDAARKQYKKLEDKLMQIGSILNQNKKLSAESDADMEIAKKRLEDAGDALGRAESVLKKKDEETAKNEIKSANSDLDEADTAVGKIQSRIDEIANKPKQDLTIVYLVAAVFIVAGVVFVAIREGWIPLYKFPWLQDTLKSAGLESLFVKPVSFEKPRFTPQLRPVSPVAGQPAYPAHRPAVQMPQMTPEQRARMQQYMKEHPEYAAYVRKKYNSYDNRRFG